MDWAYNHLLLPVFQVLYLPCDWLLGWTEYLPPVAAVTVVGVLSGGAVMVFQKYASRQKLLGQCKADLKLLKKRMKVAKQAGDRETAKRVGGLVGRISGKYMWGALKPALWTVPIISVVALWTGSRLGFEAVRPGETLAVVGHFEDRAAGFAYILPNEGLEPVGPAISPIGVPQAGQAQWQVRAAREGDFPLMIRYADRSYEVGIPVARRGGHPPENVKVFNEETAWQDQLQAVEIKLKPSMPPAWWNLKLQWAGLYLGVALLCAMPLRFLLKIQ